MNKIDKALLLQRGPGEGDLVLVTGATGYAGSALVRKLVETKCRVRAFARASSDTEALAGLPIEWIRGEISCPETMENAVKGVSVIYHLATAYRDVELPDEVYDRVDLRGTQVLALAASRVQGLKRFVQVSTCGVHGHVEDPPADENYRMKPDDIYQRKKAEAEIWIRDFSKKTGLPLTVVRPVGIYGPGDTRILKLFKLATLPVFPLIGGARGLYHLIHVDDLVKFLLVAATHPQALGEVFLCGNPNPIPLRDLVEMMASSIGNTRVHFLRIPAGPLFLAAELCERVCRPLGVQPPLYKRRIAFFTKDRAFDTRKMTDRTGFSVSRTYEEGVKETAAWYLDRGWVKPVRYDAPKKFFSAALCRAKKVFATAFRRQTAG